jgi:hypothetical protein
MLPPHVYGWISGAVKREGQATELMRLPKVPISLQGDCGQYFATTDVDGRFIFEVVNRCTYRLQSRLAGWSTVGSIWPIDLTRVYCAEVHVLLEQPGGK